MKKIILLTTTLMVSCSHRAPSNYELDRRSGLSPITEDSEDSEDKLKYIGQLRTGTVTGKEAFQPARVPSIVEKVWLYERKIGDHWMQGTWAFLEVEGEKWLSEIDSGEGDLEELLKKPKINTKTKVNER